MSHILTLSIPDEMNKFLIENADLSPSKMLQSKIIEIMDNRKMYSQEIFKLQANISKLQTIIREQGDVITKLTGEAELSRNKIPQ